MAGRGRMGWMGVLLMVGSAACDGGDGGPVAGDGTLETPLAVVGAEGTVRLAPGETARLGGGTAFVTFEGVDSDSRCPIDAVCVWEGNAAVRVRLRDPGGDSRTVTLGTHLEPRQAEVAGWTVRLQVLEPSPTASTSIDPDRYRAVFRVDRN